MKKNNLLIIAIIIAAALVLRLINLAYPNWQIFDEIYYYNFANDYLHHTYFFDVHPALGKLFITLGLLIFKGTLFGARFFTAISGTLILLFTYVLALKLFKNKIAALFALIIMFAETSLFVESRFALINIYIVLFALPAYIFFWQWRESGKNYFLYLSLIFISLSTSVKWTGLFNLMALFIFTLIDNKTRNYLFNLLKENYLKYLFIIFCCLSLPYLLFFIPEMLKGEHFFKWHTEAYLFHKNLTAGHPYASKWYQWFLDARPVWFEFRETVQGNIIGIIELGNPIILWLGLISIFSNIYFAIYYKNKALILLLLAIILNTLPWIDIKRVSFYYHFIPILPFIILSLSYSSYILWSKYKLKLLVITILILMITFFVWYWPLLNGIPISYKGYLNRIFFPGWI